MPKIFFQPHPPEKETYMTQHYHPDRFVGSPSIAPMEETQSPASGTTALTNLWPCQVCRMARACGYEPCAELVEARYVACSCGDGGIIADNGMRLTATEVIEKHLAHAA